MRLLACHSSFLGHLYRSMASLDQKVRAGLAVRVSEWLSRRFAKPVLTRKRIFLAFLAAGITDAIQLGLGPLGWIFADEALDVFAMVLTCGALGFHILLLPTFVIELLPVADLLPTWTGCVALVVFQRKRAQAAPPPTIVPPPPLPRPEAGGPEQTARTERSARSEP